MPPAAAPNSFSVNRISVLFNWQNFNSCKFFSVFLMKTAAAKFLICISIDYYSTFMKFALLFVTTFIVVVLPCFSHLFWLVLEKVEFSYCFL